MPTTTATDQAETDASDLLAINQTLETLLAPQPGCPDRLAKAMRYAALGPGKRLRPRLVLHAARACGGAIEQALPAASAVEMIHAYSLVHDDLPAMDDDDLRRGRPTLHKCYDEATAILAGDALLPLAFEVLASKSAPKCAAQSVLELAQAAGAANLVGGQSDDLIGEGGVSEKATEEEALEHLRAIHRRKTGALICASLRLGALSAGASEAQLEALTDYGQALGLAFQVTDDLLDAIGDEHSVGKRVGKDADLGKLTYPGLIGNEASRTYATELVEAATRALEAFGSEADPLREIATRLIDRQH